MSDETSFADVMSACGSASHEGGITPPELQEVLTEVHPTVAALFVRRWAIARKESGESSAEHPQFRESIERLLDQFPDGYPTEETE